MLRIMRLLDADEFVEERMAGWDDVWFFQRVARELQNRAGELAHGPFTIYYDADERVELGNKIATKYLILYDINNLGMRKLI